MQSEMRTIALEKNLANDHWKNIINNLKNKRKRQEK